MAKLTFILDDGETIEVPLHDSVTIGRADGNDVVVYDPRISSRHAELHFLPDGKFEVRDLASKAGTYVNGERVERKMLGHGDQVSFGPLRGEFSTEVVAAPEKPAPVDGEKSNGAGSDPALPSNEAAAANPEGEPKEKSEKGFLSSVIAAMGGKISNVGGKNAEIRGGKQERKANTPPAGKGKQEEKPQSAIGPAAPLAKAPTPTAASASFKPSDAKSPAPVAALVAQPSAKASEAPAPAAAPVPATPSNTTPDDSKGGEKQEADAPTAAAPASPPAGTPGQAEEAPAASAAQKVDGPAAPSGTPAAPAPASASASAPPAAAEAKSDSSPAPEAGKHVEWDKSSRVENKPSGQESPAKQKSAESTVVSGEVSKEEQPPAVPASSPAGIPIAQQQSQQAPAVVTPGTLTGPTGTVVSPAVQLLAEKSLAVEPTAMASAVPPTPSALVAAVADASVLGPVPAPASAPAPSKSTAPVVVAAAGGALDQKLVNLVYKKLEGEAREAITALEHRQKSLDAEVVRLRDEILRMQEERRTLAQEHSSLRESIQNENQELEALGAKHKTATGGMQQLVASLRQGQERLDALLAEEKQLFVVTSQLAETEKRREEVLKAIEEHHAQGEEQKAQLKSEIDGVVTDLEAKRVDFEAAMESMKLQAEAARDALTAELEAKRVDTQAAMESMKLQADAARAELQAGIDAAAADADNQRAQIRADLDKVIEECTAQRTELLSGIEALGKEEEFRQGEVQRLVATNEAALREFEAMTSNKEQMSVQLLTLLKEQETYDARLIELRRQIADAEAQARKVQELVEAREDQVKVSERRLQAIEQQRTGLEKSIGELTESENRLKSLLPQLQESEARETALTAAIALLLTRQQDSETQNASLASQTLKLQEELAAFETQSSETRTLLETNIAELQRSKQVHAEEHDRFVSETTAVKTSLTEQRLAAEEELAQRQAELAHETSTLQETVARRQELERQCHELADTDRKLTEAKAGVQKTEAQRRELDTWLKELQGKRDTSQRNLDALHHEEEASRGRLEVLRGKEKDLRTELDQLAQKEQEDRVRFEELRRLTSEADREHTAHMEELSRTLELTRRELADMEVKLAPLRDWKEAMDKRYARLASLPEDSAEARELWKEIEAEKAGLGQLIGASNKGTRGVSLNESILRGMATTGEGEAAQEGTPPPGGPASGRPGLGLKGRGNAKLHAPPGRTDAETPEERGNVGHAGTGAMLSGTGQEMALRARLSRLRESVQREATRLEFLRQERSREETRKNVSGSNEPMLKEHERQVEVKLRREEEKLATIERKIEIAEMEEEKRRERLAELERKLTELKTDILDHERTRSEAVRKADIAQVEAKMVEDMAGRVTARSIVESEPPAKTDRPVAPPQEPRSKLRTMGAPNSAPEPMDVPDSEKGMGELLLGKKPE